MARLHPSWWLASCMLFMSYPIRAAERPAVLPNTLAQRVVACTSCHAQTDQARGTEYFPRIGGKPAGYLYNQLANFR
ncbi:MAG: cytochrome C, partial [Frankiaceae bacterium]|nr:cytochrome C [Arenimonas sp.]